MTRRIVILTKVFSPLPSDTDPFPRIDSTAAPMVRYPMIENSERVLC